MARLQNSRSQALNREGNPASRIGAALLALTLFSLPFPAAGQVADALQYCTSNPFYDPPAPEPGYDEGCFPSHAQAEAFMKLEPPAPVGPVGRSLLEIGGDYPKFAGNNRVTSYHVPPRAVEGLAGEGYTTIRVPFGHAACTEPLLAFLSPTDRSCPDEDSVIDAILHGEDTYPQAAPGTCAHVYGYYVNLPSTWDVQNPYPDSTSWANR